MHFSATFPFQVFIAGPIAYNPNLNGFLALAAPETDRGWAPGVYGRRLNEFGESISMPFLILPGDISKGDTISIGRDEAISALCVVFNPLADEYFVTAQIDGGSGLTDVWGQRVSGSGALIGAPVNITDSPSAVVSHALAFAPLTSSETPAGRYLLAVSRDDGLIDLNMLNSDGNPMTVVFRSNGRPLSRSVPFTWGTVLGAAYHPDIAYGEIEGQNVFFVAWADYNNTQPYTDPNNSAAQGTGVWGGYVDAGRLIYQSTDPVPDSSFPVEAIAAHEDATTGDNWWMPRVAYSQDAWSFFVAWRETPDNNPLNDTIRYHVRGSRIDAISPSVPLDNIVLSEATGPWPGIQDPLRPSLAAGRQARILVAWDDNRNAAAGTGRDIYGELWGFPPPVNEDCINAIVIDEGLYLGATQAAAKDGGSSCGLTSAPDVWYRFTAAVDGVLRANTCGTHDGITGVDTGVDTILSLHSVCPGSTSNELTCNDTWDLSLTDSNACAGTDGANFGDSAVATPMAAGQTILIRVAGWATTPDGLFLLEATLDGCADPVDADGDKVGDACDICPANDDVWASPGEVRNLSFADSATVMWTEPDKPGAIPTALVYDVLRSSDSSNFTTGTTCLESDEGTDTQATDVQDQATGEVFYYLIRAESDCPGGVGTLGADSAGVERVGRTCP
jgi:hypothetical protein